MAKDDGNRFIGIAIRLGLLVLLGIPLVAYLWHTLNGILAGEADPQRIIVAAALLAAFLLLLALAGRSFRRLEVTAGG